VAFIVVSPGSSVYLVDISTVTGYPPNVYPIDRIRDYEIDAPRETMDPMTDWEKQLGRRRAAIKRAELALEDDIANAHADGLSWRTIGAAAEVNHEWARQAAARVAKRRAAGEQPPADA